MPCAEENDEDAAGLSRARARVASLQAELEARGGVPVPIIETHISWVLLTATEAWKLKKPVRLPFVDFTRLEVRRHCCDEELRLNRRLAPSLYLGVVEVRDGPQGATLGASGPVVDCAVRMRRFPDGALWSERLETGALVPRDIDRLAAHLAAFHRDAAVAPQDAGYGTAASQRLIVGRLIEGINAAWGEGVDPAAREWPDLRAWLQAQLRTLEPTFALRLGRGKVRECHGDLHLANLVQLGDEPTGFDGIEFDPALRWIDIVDDIAFVAMDLLARGARALAFRFLDRWFEASGDHDGLPLLRYYLVGRALVRAHVGLLAEARGAHPLPSAADYLGVAVRLAGAVDPRLAITHGLPGSGKSFVAEGLVEAAGAIRTRSDVERKRLFGLGALESSRGAGQGGIYDAASTARTYARLLEVARVGIRSGWPTVVDAAFLRASERDAFATLARELGVPFTIVDCRAPLATLRQRLVERSARGADPSEADEAVLERLAIAVEPLRATECAASLIVDAAVPWTAENLALRWRAATDRA